MSRKPPANNRLTREARLAGVGLVAGFLAAFAARGIAGDQANGPLRGPAPSTASSSPATQVVSVPLGPTPSPPVPGPAVVPSPGTGVAGAAASAQAAPAPAPTPGLEPGHFVEWGEAAIFESNLAKARDTAIGEALRNAVEAAAVQIAGPDAVAGASGTDAVRKALAEPGRFIQNYRMIQQGSVAEIYRVQLEATVLMKPLAQVLGRGGGIAPPPPAAERGLPASGAASAGETRTVYVELSGDLTYARYRAVAEALRAAGIPRPEVGIHGFRPGGLTVSVKGLASARAAADALKGSRFADFTVFVGTTGEAFVDGVLKTVLENAAPTPPRGEESAPAAQEPP